MYRIVLKVIFAITSELRGIYEYRTMQSTARNIMRSKVQHLNFDARGERCTKLWIPHALCRLC